MWGGYEVGGWGRKTWIASGFWMMRKREGLCLNLKIFWFGFRLCILFFPLDSENEDFIYLCFSAKFRILRDRSFLIRVGIDGVQRFKQNEGNANNSP